MPQCTNPVYTVLAAAAIFSRMRAWGRGALPINKMDWLSWSVSWAIHSFVLYMEPSHCAVRRMEKESYKFGFVQCSTIAAFYVPVG